jgi:predicted ATPase
VAEVEADLRAGSMSRGGKGAKSFELRAAISLARLWADQGKSAEARDLVTPVSGCFSEGFDTPDLIEAKALLDTLGP